jgi:hypothetical protein
MHARLFPGHPDGVPVAGCRIHKLETSQTCSPSTQSQRSRFSMIRACRVSGSGREGGVAGTLRTVPFGIHSSIRSAMSSMTVSGRAAHTRPCHTSWCTIVDPGSHTAS